MTRQEALNIVEQAEIPRLMKDRAVHYLRNSYDPMKVARTIQEVERLFEEAENTFERLRNDFAKFYSKNQKPVL